MGVLLLFVLSPLSAASGYSGSPSSVRGAETGPAANSAPQPLAPNDSPPPDPALVQQNGGTFVAGLSKTQSVSFSADVSSGDMVVVGTSLLGNTVTGVTDSLGSTYTPAGSETGEGGNTYVYYATLGSSAPDTVTVTANGNVEQGSVWIFEVSGATATGEATATGQSGMSSGTSTQTFQTSTSVGAAGDFLLAVVGTVELLPSPTAGSGFTLSSMPTLVESGIAEYSAAGSDVPIRFPRDVLLPFGSTVGRGRDRFAIVLVGQLHDDRGDVFSRNCRRGGFDDVHGHRHHLRFEHAHRHRDVLR